MSVAKILPLLPTVQGTLQQRSGGVTGPLDQIWRTSVYEGYTQKIPKSLIMAGENG